MVEQEDFRSIFVGICLANTIGHHQSTRGSQLDIYDQITNDTKQEVQIIHWFLHPSRMMGNSLVHTHTNIHTFLDWEPLRTQFVSHEKHTCYPEAPFWSLRNVPKRVVSQHGSHRTSESLREVTMETNKYTSPEKGINAQSKLLWEPIGERDSGGII